MCSIAGFICDKPINKVYAEHLCRALLFYGQDRGSQSAGVFTTGKGSNVLVKRAVDPTEFIDMDCFKEAFQDHVRIALCHTRQPTSGGRGDEQAQPFMNGNTVTIHNGYYHNIEEIRDKWNLKKESGVDSELVADFVEEYGIEYLDSFLETTRGPSAIAVYHKNKLYLTKTSNPLSFTRLKLDNTQMLIFASTPRQITRSLRFLVLWNNIPIKVFDSYKIFQVGTKKLKEIGTYSQVSYIPKTKHVPDAKKYTRQDVCESCSRWFAEDTMTWIGNDPICTECFDDATYYDETMRDLVTELNDEKKDDPKPEKAKNEKNS